MDIELERGSALTCWGNMERYIDLIHCFAVNTVDSEATYIKFSPITKRIDILSKIAPICPRLEKSESDLLLETLSQIRNLIETRNAIAHGVAGDLSINNEPAGTVLISDRIHGGKSIVPELIYIKDIHDFRKFVLIIHHRISTLWSAITMRELLNMVSE